MLPNMSELFRRSALEGIAPTNFFNFTREGRLMLKRSISWGVLFALTASTALAQTARQRSKTCRLPPRPWPEPTGRALTCACAYRRDRRLTASPQPLIPMTTPP